LSSGCSVLKPKPDPTQFYVLSAIPTVTAPETSKDLTDSSLHIGPWRFPEYLNTTPMVVKDGVNRLEYLDWHHWAEPLQDGVSRVLAANLSQLLNVPRVAVYPDSLGALPGYGVEFTVYHFEGTLAGELVLEVYWQVKERPAGKVLFAERSRYVVPVIGSTADAAAYAARMSEALRQWSQDIAQVIAQN